MIIDEIEWDDLKTGNFDELDEDLTDLDFDDLAAFDDILDEDLNDYLDNLGLEYYDGEFS